MLKYEGNYSNIIEMKEYSILKSRYWFTILTYILVQLSGYAFGYDLLLAAGVPKEHALAIWSVISFTIGLFIILVLLLPDIRERHQYNDRISRTSAAWWSIGGVFLAFFAQVIAAQIEMLLGIKMGSENTEVLVQIAKTTPVFILVTSIVGPILEEIIFRQIIFGSLYKKINFWLSAIISSLIFAALHIDFTHIIIYTAMGLAFSFLYVKTKRILVPIIAHVSMNTFVVVIRVVFVDDINKLQQQYEQIQSSFIGGFFL